MRKIKYFSLRKKLLIGVLLVSTIVTTLVTVTTFIFDYQQEMNQLNETLANIRATSSKPLAQSIWDYNESQMNAIARGLINTPSVVFVKINLTNDKIYEFKDSYEENVDSESNSFPIIYNDSEQNHELGTIEIVTSKKLIYKKLFNKMLVYISLQFFKTIALSLILIAFFQKFVTNHLEQLTSTLKNYRTNQFKDVRKIKLNRSSETSDELTVLTDAINLMAASTKLYNDKMEDELAQSQSHLEDEKARSMYSAKMAALGEMASGIAHEINNPLAVINGKIMILNKFLKDIPNDKQAEYTRHLNQAQKVSDKIAQIIRGLKNFSREGSQDPFVPVPVIQILEDSLTLLSEKIKRNEVEIRLPQVPQDWTIDCRNSEIAQVILNLISNGIDAIKTLEQKWIQLEVLDLEDKYQINVTDSGSGIPEEIAQKIMQPFFTTKPVGEGTGLGLSISKGLIEAHKGSFVLNRNHPHTQFQIILPKKHEIIEESKIAA